MPRPTKYSEATAERILQALRAGNTRTASALYVGIDYSTLKRWAERNAEFCAALDRAEAEAEVRYVATIAKAAGEGEWRAAVVWLERRRSDDWRERKSTELTGAGGGPIQTEDVSLSDTDRATRILAIVQRARERAAQVAGSAQPDLDAPAGAADGSVAL